MFFSVFIFLDFMSKIIIFLKDKNNKHQIFHTIISPKIILNVNCVIRIVSDHNNLGSY